MPEPDDRDQQPTPPDHGGPGHGAPEDGPAPRLDADDPAGHAPPPPPPPPPAGGTGTGAARSSPYDPGHPSGLSESVRNYGMFTHLAAFLGALATLAFVGPLVLWLIRRDEHPFIDHHGKEAVNFNLSMLLYGIVGVIVVLITFGLGLFVFLPALLVFFVLWVWATIQAAISASRGEGYRYPLTIRFIPD